MRTIIKSPMKGSANTTKALVRQSRNQGSLPLQEWNRDSRPLTYLDVSVVSEAFLHHETRKWTRRLYQFQGQKV